MSSELYVGVTLAVTQRNSFQIRSRRGRRKSREGRLIWTVFKRKIKKIVTALMNPVQERADAVSASCITGRWDSFLPVSSPMMLNALMTALSEDL